MLGLSLLPQGKVGLITLLAHTVELTTGILDILQRTTREDTILILLVIRLDIKIDRAIALVSKAVVKDLLHQLLLFDDMTRGMRFNRRTKHVQRIHRCMIAICVVLGNLHRLHLLQTGFLGNLILTLISIVLQMTHIRDVTNIPHFISQVLQIAKHQVESDGWTCMPQMGVAINRRTTDIHAHIRCMQRLETLLLPRQCIIND